MRRVNVSSINGLKQLQRSVGSLKRDIRGKRCHEVARFLGERLTNMGYKGVVVRDGIATYEAKFWENEFRKIVKEIGQRGQGIDPVFYRMFRADKHAICHSWVEIGDDVVVDYHSTVKPSPESQFTFSDLLLITRKRSLNDMVDYDPCGREIRFGKFKFILIHSPYRVFPRIMRLKAFQPF